MRGVHVLARGCLARGALRLLFLRRIDRLLEAASFAAIRVDANGPYAVPYKDYKSLVRTANTLLRLEVGKEQLREDLDRRRTELAMAASNSNDGTGQYHASEDILSRDAPTAAATEYLADGKETGSSSSSSSNDDDDDDDPVAYLRDL